MTTKYNRYLDWQPITDSIDSSKNLTILEFGCGEGTTHLINTFKYVCSYETNSRDRDGKWFNYTQSQNIDKNWAGYFDKSFPNIDIDINKFKSNVLNTIDMSAFDVLFVDPGFKQRAACVIEFAKLLHFKYIFVHDTRTEPLLYEWRLLENMPVQYKLHAEITTGQGTKLWKLTK
jgi:hypothetical protein